MSVLQHHEMLDQAHTEWWEYGEAEGLVLLVE